MKAKETLETALELVTGDRAEQHGDMDLVHNMTAELWKAFTGHGYSSKDVALMLALLKLARETCTPGNPDNLIDLAGYAAVAAELSEEKPVVVPSVFQPISAAQEGFTVWPHSEPEGYIAQDAGRPKASGVNPYPTTWRSPGAFTSTKNGTGTV